MKYIVIIGAVLSVALYYIIAEVIWQLRSRSFRRRLIIGVLIMALLASQIDFISIFTRTDADRVAAAEAGTQSRIITAFAKLPDGISKQAVPVGTALEELVLPDTLEAVCVKADTDTKTDAGTSDSQVGGGSVNQGDSEEVAPSEEAGQEDETPKNPDENSEEEVATDTVMQTETGSYTMPEYRTGNVIEVKTLEMAPAANYETIEETIIIENIIWQPEPEYDGDTEGEYVFTAILPQGYVLTNRVNTPQITVTVGGTDDTALLSGDGIMPIAEVHTHDGITFTAWTDTESLPTSGNYYLDTDVTLDYQCVLSDNANTTLNLCLNGHTVTYPLWNSSIFVGSSNTLNIYDCKGNGEVTTNDSQTLYIESGGTANIYGGTFENNGATSPNIAILGTVTIYGGTFENTSGVAISVQPNASLKIINGTFIRNNGGNIIQNQGTLEMSGGIVTGKSTITNGVVGIVNSGTSATATIKNVTVTTVGTVTDDDTADKGLRNDNGGTMTVENCNVTSTNRAVWNTGSATIKISGGIFNGRYGIYNNNGKFELSGSPTFTGSTADIYLSNNQKITVTGTLGNAAPYSVLTQTNPAVGSPVVITDSSNTSYNNADKFTPANNSYILRKNSSSQLELAMLATYTITYNAGSYGSGSVSSGTKTEGADYALSSDTFTRTGYTQTGWSKNSSGSTKDYALGAIYTDDAPITLYPYWTANQYTVRFNSAGGSSVSTTMKVTYDSTYGNLPETTRAGYTFDGWYTAETGGTKVESDTKVTIADDHTLYAKWTANEYSITYKDQGGAAFSGTHESGYPTKHTYGTATTLKSASKAGFTFSGWYTNSSCTGSAVTSLSATGYTSDITLYAKWTGPEYDITYMDQGGETFSGTHESGYPTKHAYGTATTLKSASKAGYTFNGWYTDSSCTNKVTSLGATDYTSDITLYAKWTEGTAPPKTEGGSSSDGGGSTGGNSGGSTSGSGNDSQPSNNNSGGSLPDDLPSDSVTPSMGTTPPKTGTVETVMPDAEPQKEQTKDTQTDTTSLTVGEGTVRVTVVSDGYQYAAGVTDTEAVADAVLTPEQIQLVSDGESIEIRVEVTDISDQVSQQDRDIIEGGLADYKITGDMDGEGELTLGAYIDISMYIRIGDGDWDAITKAGEPIEVVIGIPDNLLSDERTYYIARSHEGEFALLNDLDNEPDTITIKTELFSTYAIVYRQMSGTGAEGLPGFLASLSWAAVALWSLGILVMLGIVIFLIFWKRRKEEEEEIS